MSSSRQTAGGVGPGGGFLPASTSTLPSPPPSSAASAASILPTPRTHPLRPGSAKESSTRQWVETALFRVSGRYERRFARRLEAAAKAQREATQQTTSPPNDALADDPTEPPDELQGYATYAEAAADLGHVLDVLWVSGTPTLQIPFLLSLSLSASEYLPSFPFAPVATFSLLHKVDFAFSSLLSGDAAAAGRPLTMTEKVRLRGIVEETRTKVARQANDEWEDVDGVAGDSAGANQDVMDTEMETETETETETESVGERGADRLDWNSSWEVEVARVYERTIVELGMLLDAQAMIGMGSGSLG